MNDTYERDMVGFGQNPPHPAWPKDAAIAVQFVVNFEEGGENCILHGDPASEAFLSEIVGADAWPDQRHMNMESIYEFGPRAGFWRLHRMFSERKIPVTVFGIAMALQRVPEIVHAMQTSDWEIATHGLRWIDYRHVSKAEEQAHLQEAINLHEAATGQQPAGVYIGRTSEHSQDICAAQACFEYCADTYADELPYWRNTTHGSQLMVPYTLDANDMRFATPQGFNSGDQFYQYLKDSFDVLHAEGLAGAPKMMSIGLHCRLAGRPGRAAAVAKFLDYVQSKQRVWVTTRLDIARHWAKEFPAPR